METLAYRIAEAIRRDPSKTDREIAKNIRGSSTGEVRGVRASLSGGKEPNPSGGIKLLGKRVLMKKPPESVAKFIRRLPKNQGFDPSELSRDWGIGRETIRRHARELDCLRYVEVEQDDWKELVLHPETAAKFTP